MIRDVIQVVCQMYATYSCNSFDALSPGPRDRMLPTELYQELKNKIGMHAQKALYRSKKHLNNHLATF